MTVGVIGLGLIGGSFAKAIKKYTPHRVLGFDADARVMSRASENTVDSVATGEALRECDILLLALYPESVRRYFSDNLENFKKGSLIVDCAGVKRRVCGELAVPAAEAGVRFVGGHPMAGVEKSGYENSFPELFQGASMILCSDCPVPDAEEFFLSLGFGRIAYASADEHDRMIAYTSQLAHIVSSAFIKSEAAYRHSGFSANSFKDLTRVARLDEAMWTELFFENSDYLICEAEGVAYRLAEYITALKLGDRDGMRKLLRDGALAKEASENGGAFL